MRHARRFTTGLVLAATVGSGMMLGSARLEAKGKGGGGSGTVCDALAAIINYQYTSPTIRAYAMALFNGYNCDAALLN